MTRAPDSARGAAWIPSPRGLLLIAGAMALGLVVFLLVWMNTRDRVAATAPVAPTSQGPGFAPLPAPMAGSATGASGMEQPDETAAAERPHVIEAPRPAPAAPAPVPAPTVASAAPATLPVPISSPPPRYPARAQRMNETGTVRIAVDVGVDGVPTDARVESSSNSRDLDRAALEAVGKWRFKPAMRNGQPVAASIVVPVEFKL